jgi:hypothetical protein
MPRQLDQLGLFDFTSLCPVCTKPIFKFRDALKEIDAKHPQRGSVLMTAVVNGILTDEDEKLAQQQLDHDIANYVDPKLIEEHENKR